MLRRKKLNCEKRRAAPHYAVNGAMTLIFMIK
jgi:hypothetical protein